MAELNLTPSQSQRAAQMCRQLKGLRLNVKQPHGFVTGVVDQVEPAYWGGNRALVFKVVLLCGANSTPREFHLSTFNTAR